MTTTNSIVIPAKYLRFAALFAANEKTSLLRSGIEGVNVRIKDNKLVIMATDGGMLVMVAIEGEIYYPDIAFILSTEAIKDIKKDVKDVTVTYLNNVGAVIDSCLPITLSTVHGSITTATRARLFPQVSRVVPYSLSGEHSVFASKYYVLIDKAQKLLNPSNKDAVIRIWENGVNASIVDFNDVNICAVIMPFRLKDGREEVTYSRPGFTR
tara:strand:- start:60 stop:692 length:633 start_codon:yes stop_codon:yes gene_type:complete